MGTGRRPVVWSGQASAALEEAVAYVWRDSPSAALELLQAALDAGASLSRFWERGRVVPEVGSPAIRELFVLRYRLMYEIREEEIGVIAFVHGARDFRGSQGDQ